MAPCSSIILLGCRTKLQVVFIIRTAIQLTVLGYINFLHLLELYGEIGK